MYTPTLQSLLKLFIPILGIIFPQTTLRLSIQPVKLATAIVNPVRNRLEAIGTGP